MLAAGPPRGVFLGQDDQVTGHWELQKPRNGEAEAVVVNRRNGRIAAGAAGAVLLLATGAAAAVPASAVSRDSTVTCPTVNPKTGAVTPKPANWVNWSGCDLAGANLTRASLDFANLSDANLAKAVVAHAGFEVTDFAGANLTDVSGNNADFDEADFAGANLSGASLLGAQFYSGDFTSAKLVHADLAHSDAGGITTDKADFTGAILNSDRLYDATFDGADLEGADLGYATLTGAVLNGADLAGVRSGGLLGIPRSLPASFSVSGGYLAGPYADLAGAHLAGAFAVNDSFAHANLAKADLDNADLSSADFDGANAAGALLNGADLAGAELTATNASLKNVTWSAGTICPNGHAASAKTGCFAKPAHPRPPAIEVSVRRGAPGTTLTLTGSGFAPRETLTVSFDGSKLATVTTGSAGSAGPLTLTVPRSAQPGLHQVTAAGKGKTGTAGAWFTVAADWVQAAYDSGLTSHNALENALTPAKARALAKKFLVNPGAGTSGAFAASIYDGVAYVASAKGPLTAVNAATGAAMWTWKEPGGWDSTGTNPHDQLSQPVLLNGIVYLSVAGQGIVALRPPGTLIWESHLEDAVYPNPLVVDLSQPTLAGGVLYATDGNNLYAVNTATGYPLAQAVPAPIQLNEPECGQPAVAGGVVYVRCGNGNLYAFTAPALKPLWTYAVPGTAQTGRLAVSGGTVYLTTSSASGGGLVAISASTHKKEWSVKTAATVNAPAIAGNVVYAVASSGLLFAQNAATGAHLWSAKLSDKTPGNDTFHPSVADGVVYALSNAGVASAFNAKTGARLWSYQSGGTLQTAPVIANGILYIGTKSGGVEAIAVR
jgi:uncharacterized protein YjbI with pentapeptide repeats/outer membrane protein assembly factor BamB